MSSGAVVGGQVPRRASDRVAGVVDVAPTAVGLPGCGHELHRSLRTCDRRTPDAPDAGLHQVDGGQVLPRDAELRLGLAVGAQEVGGRVGRDDAPGREGARELGVHAAELPAGRGVQPGRRPRRSSGSAAATSASHSGCAPSFRYATCWRRAAPRGVDLAGVRVAEGSLRGRDLLGRAPLVIAPAPGGTSANRSVTGGARSWSWSAARSSSWSASRSVARSWSGSSTSWAPAPPSVGLPGRRRPAARRRPARRGPGPRPARLRARGERSRARRSPTGSASAGDELHDAATAEEHVELAGVVLAEGVAARRAGGPTCACRSPCHRRPAGHEPRRRSSRCRGRCPGARGSPPRGTRSRR